MLTPAQLDEIEAAAKNASPGPWGRWEIDGYDGDGIEHTREFIADATGAAIHEGDDPFWHEQDGDFLIAANPAVVLVLVQMARKAAARKAQR